MSSPIPILSLLIFIALVHIVATVNLWYFTYPWFDIPMHFLGGVWLATLFLWLNERYHLVNPVTSIGMRYGVNSNSAEGGSPPDGQAGAPGGKIAVILIGLGFVILIGVLWEFFEFSVDLFSAGQYLGPFRSFNYGIKDLYKDTLGDLLSDLAGGVFVATAFLGKKSNSAKNLK